MFIIERASLVKATQRARELQPTVIADGMGGYRVSGSAANDYTVTIRRVNDFHIVNCTCETRDSIACKHGIAAFAFDQILSEQVFTYR
jgi:uncharacterized Zn finger protein